MEQIGYPLWLAGCSAAARSVETTYRYGRPVAVTDLATPGVPLAAPITYNENGTLATVQHSNGVLYTQGIDPKRIARPKSIRAERAGVALWQQENYAYDEAGNISQIGAKRFTYDGLSRLTSATYPAVSGPPYREYLYDRFGNLTDVKSGGRKAAPDTVTVTYPTSTSTNRLEAPAAIYDTTGRLTTYSNTLYAWDVLDQMTKVDGTAAGSEAWIHVYNPAGERVWSWRTSASRKDTFTVRDTGGKVLTLFNKLPGTPNPSYTWEDYVYRDGLLLAAKMSDGAVKHFDLDHLGSVRLETDANGAVLAYRDFWPYGEEITTPTATERMKFTGHERDLGVLGSNVDDLDYMHARYYRPLVGRFLTLDKVGGRANRPGTWNRYVYAGGNPIRLFEPNGLAEKDYASTMVVRVNLIYSNADKVIWGNQTLRQVNEKGLAEARTFFAKAGISLDMKRYEGTIHVGSTKIDGLVKTDSGTIALSAMFSEAKGLTVLVSGDLPFTGKTNGIGGPTRVGVAATPATLPDELAHALGNVAGVSGGGGNTFTDLVMDFNEALVGLGLNMNASFEETLRETASNIGCVAGQPNCPEKQ